MVKGLLGFTDCYISMKIINCNNWAPCNQLNIPIPITDLPVDLQGLLSTLYFAYSPGRLS